MKVLFTILCLLMVVAVNAKTVTQSQYFFSSFAVLKPAGCNDNSCKVTCLKNGNYKVPVQVEIDRGVGAFHGTKTIKRCGVRFDFMFNHGKRNLFVRFGKDEVSLFKVDRLGVNLKIRLINENGDEFHMWIGKYATNAKTPTIKL